MQSLMDAAVRTRQLQRVDQESDRDSDASVESGSSGGSAYKSGHHNTSSSSSKPEEDSKRKKTKKKKSKSSSLKDKMFQERLAQYREGKKNLPSYEVIQDSFHLLTGKVDMQLCSDMDSAGMTDTVQGSMLIQVSQPGPLVSCHASVWCAGL